MKKINNALWYILVLLPMMLWGCQKDKSADPTEHFLMSDTQDLVFEQVGGTQEIAITAASSSNWSIDEASLDEWLKVHREGDKIIVTAEENDQVEMRSSRITVVLPGSKYSFSISQFGTEPTIIIKDGISVLKFNRDRESKTIQVISNSTNWTVSPFGEIPWLKWVKNDDNTLTLNVDAFRKEDPDSRKSRKGVIFLSNANQHVQINIIQKGWLQFVDPYYLPLTNRQAIIELEKERGNVRNIDYERRHFPQGQDVDKHFLAFTSDAEQTPLIVYKFERDLDPNYQIASGEVHLKARENGVFVKDDLLSWMELNNYTESPRSDRFDESQLRFFRAKDDVTGYFDVKNSEKSKFNAFDYPGAYMTYRESSNFLKLNPDGTEAETFPTRNAHRLHDVNFKIDDVIKYEASMGMVPDYFDKLSIKSNDPKIRYFSLVFKPTGDSQKVGTLKIVHYVFNCKEAVAYDKGLEGKVFDDPKLEGTVGQRQDVYVGKGYVYRMTPYEPRFPEWGSKHQVKSAFTSRATLKGYVLGRFDESGYVTYYRGKDELVDIRPQADGVIFQYYKNKNYVDNFTK